MRFPQQLIQPLSIACLVMCGERASGGIKSCAHTQSSSSEVMRASIWSCLFYCDKPGIEVCVCKAYDSGIVIDAPNFTCYNDELKHIQQVRETTSRNLLFNNGYQ